MQVNPTLQSWTISPGSLDARCALQPEWGFTPAGNRWGKTTQWPMGLCRANAGLSARCPHRDQGKADFTRRRGKQSAAA